MTTTLITGANRGLGLETARRLIELGHTVYAGVRDPSRADAVRDLGATVVALDVTDQASVDAGLASIPELDVLINNAGIDLQDEGLEDLTTDTMQQVFDTNVLGLVRVTQAALPVLRRSSNPVIVNVTSTVGWPRVVGGVGTPEFFVKGFPYPASKAAVIVTTVQYAKSLPEFRVNVVNPGYTATDMNFHRGHQNLTEGTDAMVAMATIGPDGPTGEFWEREGRIDY